MTTLPAAVAGDSGTIVLIKMKRCWANRSFRQAGVAEQCSQEVSETDDLGLCPEHIEEFRSS